jgi:predicted DCC family thiol-disulfide oxidoreductase YuxK
MLSERRSGFSESVWRAGFGLWLLAQFTLAAWPAVQGLRNSLGALGMLAALLLACGWLERPLALLLALLWVLGPLQSAAPAGAWSVVLLLVLQFCLPRAPYGSLAAVGRADPGGRWSMPDWILRLRFAALFVCASSLVLPENALASGSGLALAGAAAGVVSFALIESALGWAWLALLLAAIAADGSEFLWLALAANAQPGWIPPWRGPAPELVFYDGGCALCHGLVRFLLAEDPRGSAFRFAPIESEALREVIPVRELALLPDSFVVRTCEGRTLLRSAAVLHVLRRLGGWPRLWGEVLRLVPEGLADLAYSGVARVRKRVFGTKSEACPMLPRHLRARFEA